MHLKDLTKQSRFSGPLHILSTCIIDTRGVPTPVCLFELTSCCYVHHKIHQGRVVTVFVVVNLIKKCPDQNEMFKYAVITKRANIAQQKRRLYRQCCHISGCFMCNLQNHLPQKRNPRRLVRSFCLQLLRSSCNDCQRSQCEATGNGEKTRSVNTLNAPSQLLTTLCFSNQGFFFNEIIYKLNFVHGCYSTKVLCLIQWVKKNQIHCNQIYTLF